MPDLIDVIKVYIYIYIYILKKRAVSTSPYEQDLTQARFLSGDYQVLMQGFPSPRLVALLWLKRLVCTTIYP